MYLDQLDYKIFNEGRPSNKRDIRQIKDNNRILAETENFFSVAGFGSFLKGYILIITKKKIPSIAHIQNKELNEFIYFKELMLRFIRERYKSNYVEFEHGMCSCAGGLDHAHIHLMQYPKSFSKIKFSECLDEILKKRAAGIYEIVYNDMNFTHPNDISSIISMSNKYKITKGRLLKSADIFEKNHSLYPLGLKKDVLSNKQYIYFKSNLKNNNFLTNQHLGAQFGRELIFNIFENYSKSFKNKNHQLLQSSLDKYLWRWQDFNFEKNIYDTMIHFSNFFRKKKYSKKYKIKINFI